MSMTPDTATILPLHAMGGAGRELAVEAFEAKRAAQMRRNALTMSLGTAFGLGLVFWAFQTSGFSGSTLAQDSLGKIGDFILRMDPNLNSERLFEDRTTHGSLAHWFRRWPQWRDALIETIEMAVVATILCSLFGILTAILSARTTMPIFWVRWITKRILEIIRTIPDLIMAILFVSMFGLGPLAGLLTLTISGSASLGRFFGEVLESIDKRPRDAMRASGATWAQQIRFGVLPQISPVLTSMTFYRFEISISSASTLGIVGAGGIGQELTRALTFNQFDSYLAILILIITLIVIADLASGYLRKHLAQERMAS